MVFEAFLGDPRTRPMALRLFGYLVSAMVHLPPVGMFIVGAHGRSFVIDHTNDPPMPNYYAITFFRVPADVPGSLPGGGSPNGGIEGAAAAGQEGGHGQAMQAFRQKRRRPLILPHGLKQKGGPQEEAADIGLEQPYDDENDASGGANSTGQHGRGAPIGAGSGNGVAGTSPGSGGHAVAHGSGVGTAGYGIADGKGGLPRETPVSSRGKGSRAAGAADSVTIKVDSGGVASFVNAAGDEDTDPLPGRPARISMESASYLRTYEVFPTLPDSCWPPGRTNNEVLLEICVTEGGSVTDVIPRAGTAPEYDDFVASAVRTWRYRPLVLGGSARPFCHLMRITYTRVSPFSLMHW